MQKHIAIICGSFHKAHVLMMLKEARRIADEQDLFVAKEIWVPGSLEKPLALKHILASEDIAGAVVLGIIEKGETKHGLTMGIAVISAIIDLQLQYNKPIGIGILGPEILPQQIESRLLPHAKGAVMAVKTMLALFPEEK